MVGIFSYQKSNFGIFKKDSGMENFGIFNGHSVHILCSYFVYDMYGHFIYFVVV
jgi:hypothetical protein